MVVTVPMGPTTTTVPLLDRVNPSAASVQHAISDKARTRKQAGEPLSTRLPQPSISRLEASHHEEAFSVKQLITEPQSEAKDKTVLYLAYGSNLQAAKFRGDRGIKPLAQINVQVPSLRMTFDLPGIPYTEPCFANTARRDSENDCVVTSDLVDEKTALRVSEHKEKYRKRDWHKSLIGVVYEVTKKDYAHIIATEGGGAGYQDILVDCHPFASADPNTPVPDYPSLPPFKAHTLFAPRLPKGSEPPNSGGHIQRPDPDYAQASARYLNIIKEGAAECELPYEYQTYLQSLRPYTITTAKQRVGQFVFLSVWGPIIMSVFALGKLFTDKHGKLPDWTAKLMNGAFKATWESYDTFFKPMFGEGERTIGNGQEERRKESHGLPLLPLHQNQVLKAES